MQIPQINENDVAKALGGIQDIHYMTHGGQKSVFSCRIAGNPYVIKFLAVEPPVIDADGTGLEATIPELDAVVHRAKREVDTMAKCSCPNLVKLGPIGLSTIEINGQRLLYFTEEKIEGEDLRRILDRDHNLGMPDVIRLGQDAAAAIDALWALRRIHRDVKPGNIMRRYDSGAFVLLDVGLVFDLKDISLTAPYTIVGTPMYFSPEQMEMAKRRQLDFRSDLFALGIVLYESATGQHPFTKNCKSTSELMASILYSHPVSPRDGCADMPQSLERIIMRLLAKSPHLRYRDCKQLVGQLEQVHV